VAENNTLRTTIVGGTVAALLASLLLEPVRAFIASVWRLVTAVPGAVWHLVTASVPVWVLVVGGVVVALIARRVGRRAPPIPEVYDVAPRMYRPPRVEQRQPAPRLRLTELEDGILRRLARADGGLLLIDELGSAKTKQLRLEQALEHLCELGLVDEPESDDTSEPLYGLTPLGRDFVIARGDV
jgi:hypothetical protein